MVFHTWSNLLLMKVWLTRDQFNDLNIKNKEELLGAFQGQFIELILSKKITDDKRSIL